MVCVYVCLSVASRAEAAAEEEEKKGCQWERERVRMKGRSRRKGTGKRRRRKRRTRREGGREGAVNAALNKTGMTITRGENTQSICAAAQTHKCAHTHLPIIMLLVDTLQSLQRLVPAPKGAGLHFHNSTSQRF